MKERVAELLTFESNAVKNIPLQDSFDNCVTIINNQVHLKNGKLVTSGMGKAGQIALNMATTFSSTGTPAAFLHPSEAQHGDLGLLQKNDVLLLISNSGKTREIIELIELAKRLIPNIPIIVITGQKDSYLAKKADAFIWTGNPGEICPLGLSPTTSTTVMNVIGNILVVLMMEKINFTNADYANRHHGGYLGDKSRTQAKQK
jgi:arabinose-5-phosphate isomerase